MKALEQRGFSIIIKAGDRISNVYVVINNIEQKIILSEKMKQIISPNYNSNNHWTNKYELIPSGIFKLEIDEVYNPYEIDTKAVRDTQTLKLENRLNEFIVALLKGSVAKKKREEYFEEVRIKREKKEEERRQLLNLIKAEKKKLENLMDNVKMYYKMRLYIRAFEEDYVNKYGKVESGSETESWIKWAYNQADRVDPLKESQPSVLDKINQFNTWEWEIS